MEGEEEGKKKKNMKSEMNTKKNKEEQELEQEQEQEQQQQQRHTTNNSQTHIKLASYFFPGNVHDDTRRCFTSPRTNKPFGPKSK